MKKLSILLTMLLLLSLLASCGNEPTKEYTTNDVPDASTGTFDLNTEKIDIATVEPVKVNEAKIELDLSHMKDIIIDIEPYDKTMDNSIKFDVSDFDIEKVVPVKVKEAVIDFKAEDFALNLGQNLTEAELAQIDDIDSEAMIKAVQTKYDLLNDLMMAFKTSGSDLSFSVNKNSGEITLDASVLFANDVAQVSDEGKAFLKKFIPIYTSVLLDSKYSNFVAKILVEGHTDTNGSHDYNQNLSEKRAENVKAFCLSDESGLSADVISALSKKIQSAGHSYDYPIYDSNGKVDMAASRRVSFKFIINLK